MHFLYRREVLICTWFGTLIGLSRLRNWQVLERGCGNCDADMLGLPDGDDITMGQPEEDTMRVHCRDERSSRRSLRVMSARLL